MPLAQQWPTLDPFLFCAHHHDGYPAANDRFGPAVPLDGRDLGMDFSGRDGWSMYHGRVVPGFPQHPHRGFETVSYARRGLIDHADSLGAAGRYGRGDVQWMTAGGGIVHAEMFPLLDRGGPNPIELLQIWLNLPAEDKLVDPHFSMLWDSAIPRRETVDDEGRAVQVTIIAGALGELRPPAPPPSSWAARPDSDVAIWNIQLAPGATWNIPPAASSTVNRMLYVYEGDGATIASEAIPSRTGAVVRPEEAIVVESGPTESQILMLSGRPIGEPVAQHGPFVLNDRAGIVRAIDDYQRTGFGGWPWPADDPVHGREPTRFAHHADGRQEAAPA